MSGLHQRLLAGFEAAYRAPPEAVARAPGRVNLIGEHTDYNDGFALPAALGVETQVAWRRRHDGEVRVAALDYGGESDTYTPAADLQRAGGWKDYVRGVFATLAQRGFATPGMDIAIAGSVPKGTGLSSSASLEVALVRAVTAISGDRYEPVEAALLAQAAENDFVGMRCGNLDQLAAAGTVEGHALLIDCRSLELQPVPMPAGTAIVIVQSGVSRGLVDGHYNRRRESCEEASRALGVPALRDADLAMLEAGRGRLDEESYRRARHVISENDRTLAATEALRAGDLVALGALMAQSHVSMRDDFDIVVEPTDRLAALLSEAIGREGGARQTGGGFGGAVVAVLRSDAVARVVRAVEEGYRTPTGDAPMVMVEEPRGGASLVA